MSGLTGGIDPKKGSEVENTLHDRSKTYGKFSGQAEISQSLKSIMRSTRNWESLKPNQKEALEMIQHKVARILNGDPNYIESWRDIAGYAIITKDILMGTDGSTDSTVIAKVVKNGVLIDEKSKS